MMNLDQIRAAHALQHAANLDKGAVSKLPALIINNGLLATTAFVLSDGGGDNRRVMLDALGRVAAHLQARGIIQPPAANAEQLMLRLTEANSQTLQVATQEALAYLGYLKRFARPA